ncbi:hypothetical protein ILYODFUR_004751 [Ilyodon furcidens]|uniref:Uncharacterized protein n=2 Tax=Goodeidae TaxID=28758 RepID=A0ABU7DCT4_9TELE|nr:hypothetical protein [Characodon lateralis]
MWLLNILVNLPPLSSISLLTLSGETFSRPESPSEPSTGSIKVKTHERASTCSWLALIFANTIKYDMLQWLCVLQSAFLAVDVPIEDSGLQGEALHCTVNALPT